MITTGRHPMLRDVDPDYESAVRETAERFRDGRNHTELTFSQAVRANRQTWNPPYTTESIDAITFEVFGARRKE